MGGDVERLRGDARESLAIATELACASCAAQALVSLLLVDRCDDLGGPVEAARRSLQLADGIQETMGVVRALDMLVGALAAEGDAAMAVRVAAATHAAAPPHRLRRTRTRTSRPPRAGPRASPAHPSPPSSSTGSGWRAAGSTTPTCWRSSSSPEAAPGSRCPIDAGPAARQQRRISARRHHDDAVDHRHDPFQVATTIRPYDVLEHAARPVGQQVHSTSSTCRWPRATCHREPIRAGTSRSVASCSRRTLDSSPASSMRDWASTTTVGCSTPSKPLAGPLSTCPRHADSAAAPKPSQHNSSSGLLDSATTETLVSSSRGDEHGPHVGGGGHRSGRRVWALASRRDRVRGVPIAGGTVSTPSRPRDQRCM